MSPRKKAEVDELEIEDDFEVEEDEEATAAKKGKGKTKAKKEDAGVGARQLAEEIGVDPKTFRAWLRRMVSDGKIEMDHDHKSRYNFGKTINSPQAKAVIKLWKDSSHEKGRKKKEEEDSDEDE